MKVCPVCTGQGCSHCNRKGYHGSHPMGGYTFGHCNCAHPDCPSCNKQQQLGMITINKQTGAGISVATGLVGAIAWPMLTGGLGKELNANRKAKNIFYGFLIGGIVGGLGSFAGYQIQN